MSAKPIGIFDSGAGGLSIWKEISLLMPRESTAYISDAAWIYCMIGSDTYMTRQFLLLIPCESIKVDLPNSLKWDIS